MTNEQKVRIMVINKQNYLGRKCTEQEIQDEIATLFLKSLIGDTGEEGISKESFFRILEDEDLKGYVYVKANSYDCSGEYQATINNIDGYYTLLATGERGGLAINDAYETVEQVYYGLLQYMRKVKKSFEGTSYKPK